ncbi:MAG TPA: hypothetical protein VHE61_00475 [Opitutaceae bacterium]|nr:hypothetical protein [Opitutaceae bacterium]
MNKYAIRLAVACLIATATRLSAGVTSIDYTTGFTSPTQVITSDQATGTISGDPTTGVTFTNSNLFHFGNGNGNTIENYNPYTYGFGGSLLVSLPTLSDAFGLDIGANSGGQDAISFGFYSGNTLVGSGSFTLPFGNPTSPLATAFSSTIAFDSVLINAPVNGYMAISDDSIKFQAAPVAAPDTANTLACLGLALFILALIQYRSRTADSPLS